MIHLSSWRVGQFYKSLAAYLGQCKHPTLKALLLSLQHGADIMFPLSF